MVRINLPCERGTLITSYTEPIKDTVVAFQPHVTSIWFEVKIIDDDDYEPDEVSRTLSDFGNRLNLDSSQEFYVTISDPPDPEAPRVVDPQNNRCTIEIIDDDNPGSAPVRCIFAPPPHA